MTKKKHPSKREMKERASRGGRRSADRLTQKQRSERARRAAAMRYGRERERDEAEARAVVARLMKAEVERMESDPETAPHRLVILRDGKLIGVVEIDTAKLTLHVPDAELEGLYKTATTEGIFSLGDIDAPQPEDGTIVDHAHYDKLVPGDLKGFFVFGHELASRGYAAKLTQAIVPKPNINPRFIATHFYMTPHDEPKRPEVKRGKKD